MRVKKLFSVSSDEEINDDWNDFEDDQVYSSNNMQQQQQQLQIPQQTQHIVRRNMPSAPLHRNGEVELPLEDYLALCSAADQSKSTPALPALVERAHYHGEEAHDSVQLDAVFRVTFLSDDWVCVELFPDTVSVTSHSVSRAEPVRESAAGALPPRAELGVARGQLCLFGRGRASYEVEVRVRCPFQSSRASSFSLSVPTAVRNSLVFTVHSEAEIKVEAALNSTHRSFDAQQEDSVKEGRHTEVTAELRPTEVLAVQWKRAAALPVFEDIFADPLADAPAALEHRKDAPVVAVEREIITNAEQLSVHSIGEGIVLSSVTYKFEILHGSRSLFELVLPQAVRVLSVEGVAIKRWDVATKEGVSTLKVSLEYAMEALYALELRTELKMASTSCDVQLPRFACLQVNRERGFIAVEARTSVEVRELSSTMLAPMGISELPEEVTKKAQNPLLFGYRFLVGGASELEVRVKKHKDVPVLVAVVETCHVVATLEENKLMFTVNLHMRNTQTQFLRLTLPEGAVVWSTMVAGKPVKPARDTDNDQLMIPLLKSSANNADASFTAEVVFLQTLAKGMEKSGAGKLALTLAPVVDVPINALLVSLFLPTGFEYGAFSSPNIREVTHFSVQAPAAGAPPMPRHVQNALKPAPKKKRAKMELVGAKGRLQSAMVTPVKVQMCTSGREFRFEQFLVAGEEFVAEVEYRKEQKVLDVRRSRRRFKNLVALLIALLAVSLLRWLFF